MLRVVRRDRQAHLRCQLGACHSTPRGVHCRGPQCVQTIRCNHRHCSDNAAVQVNAATQVQGHSKIHSSHLHAGLEAAVGAEHEERGRFEWVLWRQQDAAMVQTTLRCARNLKFPNLLGRPSTRGRLERARATAGAMVAGGSPHLEFRVRGALHHKVPLEYVVLHMMYTKP